jgi:hypothetical protein
VDEFGVIRDSRKRVLSGLSDALDRINREIAATTRVGPYLERLGNRQQDLLDEMRDIRASATDHVLALPQVIAARVELTAIGERMTERGRELVEATDLLGKAGEILAVGQSFADLLATIRK